ncbi:hypothetical protein M2651_05625 [Clostridium sp. SYSU_GA19001]|uniref:hypothetical protein n=1 Tax=Clostridium caldaquaticum TaxID=2940653 RepID=UPI002077380D|nr:hypothetical protein [Clostridium caldaquaticum]MCM8710504.1 hypothetical protein [Clostridium caldaquaticum]
MSNIVLFEGQEVSIITDKGEKLINLAHTAKCCGLINLDRGVERISWKNRNGVVDKLKKLYGADAPKKYQEEIQYILDEIENTDDRNSIYMSSWLSKRLALECHSERAMRYKNFLVSLDEERENTLTLPNMELANMVSQTVQGILPSLTESIIKQFAPVIIETKQQVNKMQEMIVDQSINYDQDREDLKSLIGFRAVNTKRLTEFLKEKLSEVYGMNVSANSQVYQRTKALIFKEFKVIKWEDIPASKYNMVYAFIDNLDFKTAKGEIACAR